MHDFHMRAHLYHPHPESPLVGLGDFWRVGQPIFLLIVLGFVCLLAFVYFYKRRVKD